MGKIKSAICLTLITLVIAVLCVVCFVPFPVGGDGVSYYNPLINWTEKTADLGGFQFGEDSDYIGGSFSVVLYPEGVISKREYEDNLSGKTGDEKTEYAEEYVAYADGSIYLNKETVCDGGTTVSEEFAANFKKDLDLLSARFERLRKAGLNYSLRDDYTVYVQLPASMDASVVAFLYFSHMGGISVRYGSDSSSATVLFPEEGRNEKPIGEYMKGASLRDAGGTAYVGVHFTKLGRKLIADATAGAAESASTLFIMAGDVTIINLSVSTQIDENDLFVSGSYTPDTAAVVAAVIDTGVKLEADGALGMEMGEFYRTPASFGTNALTLLYIALGVCFVLMAAFFLFRYRRLGFAHLYSYLIFLLAIVLCAWAIPIAWGMETVAAFVLVSLLLCASNAISYEYVRKEFATGKTIASSVKAGYKRCLWHLIDLHLVVAVVGVLLYLIALAELSAFGLVLVLGALFSAICSLAINRFMWYIMMPFAKTPGAFCHFKREEVDDE